MKRPIVLAVSAIISIGLFGCARKHSAEWKSIQNPEITAQLKSFVAEKTAQAKADGSGALPEFNSYFAAAQQGDWLSVSNQFENFRNHAGQYEHTGKTDENLRGSKWAAVIETWGALYYFGACDEKYSTAFGKDIIDSIPAGSIYFGGTDPGRFLITALQKSHVNGDPFFTLTQNALADGGYLTYVRGMYGDKIHIPTAEDLEKTFQDYTEDATRRMQNHQLKPGEIVTPDASGKMQASGVVSVMEINGLLAKIIFDKNPDREFYIEESFPLDWMYPHLEPHGLIMEVNRQSLAELSDDIVSQDHDYWTKYVTPMIGGWLNDDTPVSDVTAFAEKVYLRHDLSGFAGDSRFVQNDDACRMFSKLRVSIARIYMWRLDHAADETEKQRMARAADFAFRQALALCPSNPEIVSSYMDFLNKWNRGSDARLVGKMARQLSKRK